MKIQNIIFLLVIINLFFFFLSFLNNKIWNNIFPNKIVLKLEKNIFLNNNFFKEGNNNSFLKNLWKEEESDLIKDLISYWAIIDNSDIIKENVLWNWKIYYDYNKIWLMLKNEINTTFFYKNYKNFLLYNQFNDNFYKNISNFIMYTTNNKNNFKKVFDKKEKFLKERKDDIAY